MKFTRINKDEFAEFYTELQAINDFEADFRITARSRQRREYLLNKINNE
jgi:hypothetical protein